MQLITTIRINNAYKHAFHQDSYLCPIICVPNLYEENYKKTNVSVNSGTGHSMRLWASWVFPPSVHPLFLPMTGAAVLT